MMGAWEFAVWVALWAAILAKPGSIDPILPVVLSPLGFMVVWGALFLWAFYMFRFPPKKP